MGGDARKRRLSPNGASWLRGLHVPGMELPDAIVTSLVFFDVCPSTDAVVDAFKQHFWPLFRCSSRVADGHFVKVDGPMDQSYHFSEQHVRDEAEIDAFAQKVMSQPLDISRPLWKVAILKAKTGRSAVLIRVHHVISDGLGLLFAFLPMMSSEQGNVIDHIPLPAILLGKKVARRASPRESGNPILRVMRGVSSCLSGAAWFFRGVLSLLVVPMDSSIKMNAPAEERKPFLRYTGAHTFTRMPPVPLDLVKKVREKHGCTVNDVLMCGLAGAIRRYGGEELGDPLFSAGGRQKVECKCTMLLGLPRPVDPKDPGSSMCNNILTPILRLPVDDPSPEGRLQRTVATIGNLKSAPFLAGIRLTTKLVTAVFPVFLAKKVASECISKLTANVTSLPMPTVPMRVFGQEVKEMQALFVNNVPQICMVSYNGSVNWNIIADPKLLPEARELGKQLLKELEELAR